jgi:hypothetical protein
MTNLYLPQYAEGGGNPDDTIRSCIGGAEVCRCDTTKSGKHPLRDSLVDRIVGHFGPDQVSAYNAVDKTYSTIQLFSNRKLMSSYFTDVKPKLFPKRKSWLDDKQGLYSNRLSKLYSNRKLFPNRILENKTNNLLEFSGHDSVNMQNQTIVTTIYQLYSNRIWSTSVGIS